MEPTCQTTLSPGDQALRECDPAPAIRCWDGLQRDMESSLCAATRILSVIAARVYECRAVSGQRDDSLLGLAVHAHRQRARQAHMPDSRRDLLARQRLEQIPADELLLVRARRARSSRCPPRSCCGRSECPATAPSAGPSRGPRRSRAPRRSGARPPGFRSRGRTSPSVQARSAHSAGARGSAAR